MVPMMPKPAMRRHLATLLLAGAVVAAPVTLRLEAGNGLRIVPALAHAKDGDRGGDDRGGDDRGGDDRGGRDDGGHGGDDRGGDRDGRGDDRGGDDRGGGRGRGGDDRGSDDRGGRSDDRGGRDDHGGRGRGHDDGPATPGGGIGGGQAGAPAVEVERSAGGIEVTYADGWREELENGRYELKDAQGRTVVERRATDQDLARLSSFSR